MISLQDLVARVKACPHWLPKDVKWELCQQCTMLVCAPKALGCAARQRRLDLDLKRSSRMLVENIGPERAAAQRQKRRDYYAENREIEIQKNTDRRAGKKPSGVRLYRWGADKLRLSEIAKLTGIGKKTLTYRLNTGMTIKEAVETPVLTRQQAARNAAARYREQRGYA